jgi:diguanylate cyclase (GGDEF)-like protein
MLSPLAVRSRVDGASVNSPSALVAPIQLHGTNLMRKTPGRLLAWRPSRLNSLASVVTSRAFAFVGIALLVANLAWVIVFAFARTGTPFSPLWDGWIGNLAMVVPIAACVVLALRGGPRRTAALWLGAGMICWAAGNALYLVWIQFETNAPAPSSSDFAYFGFYVCVVGAMISLARRDIGAVPKSLWLDGVLGAVGAATVLAAALNSVLVRPAGNLGHVVVNAGFTVGDLVLVAMICGLLATRGTRGRSLLVWMAAGIAVFCAADSAYALQVSAHSFTVGAVLSGLWMTGITILALAMWRPYDPRPSESSRSTAVLAVPILATAAAVVVLVISSFNPMSVIVVGLAATTLLLAVVRTFVSFRQVRELAVTRELAFSDDLTGLANRRYLFEHGELRLQAKRDGDRLALMMIDLDNFKDVNDALGHSAGDELLRETSRRLAACIRDPDMLVRLGGDEFALLISLQASDVAVATATRILDRISRAFLNDGASMRITASIGIAEVDGGNVGIAELLRRADLAMYAAKSSASRVQRYNLELDEANLSRLETVHDLDAAFVNHEFVLHYQPKVDVRTRITVSSEALVRWQHPTRGLLGPDAFLPEVERSGMMALLTRVVLETSVAQLAAWRQSGLMLSVAVNLSASDLLDEQLPSRIVALLGEHDVPVGCLELEITEHLLMTDPARVRAVLEELCRAGLRIAIDDYGTGYSSLAYLRDLPVDELKIDRSFVARIATDERSAAIVSSTIDLAHALDLKVVAEGVEFEETLHALDALECDFAQGYHFSRALPAEAFEAWLRNNSATPVLSGMPV